MKNIYNEQYNNFILKEVIRPFQPMIKDGKRIERLVFEPTDKADEFYYADLNKLLANYNVGSVEWRTDVISRIAKYYEYIDFSFFPTCPIAATLQRSLMDAGVKQLPNIYLNSYMQTPISKK